MLILGLETTCDETAAAIIERDEAGRGRILSNIVRTQLALHAPFGGVVPELAARAHIDVMDTAIELALSDAGLKPQDLDGVAGAAGPGLIGGVIVGLTSAKAFAFALQKPFIAINHLEAHALTPRLLGELHFPYLFFLASGGHTQLLAVLGVGKFVRLGTTIDDAIGEAFDKVAKMMSLAYPGGPEVEARAKLGNPHKFALPRPLKGKPGADFSLSGLKTAVRLAAEHEAPLTSQTVNDLCASFQQAVCESVEDRLKNAYRLFETSYGKPTAIVTAGGVGANLTLRASLDKFAANKGISHIVPPIHLCTDNGAMIAWAGAERLALGLTNSLDFAPKARWALTELHA
jgi:N6-L-threonylcarbamoyladenine synthase